MDIPIVLIPMPKRAWITGSVGDYLFEAKVSAEPSEEGYRNGKVYKFEMRDKHKNFIAYYDHGKWAEGKLNDDQRKCFLAVVKQIDKIDFMKDEKFNIIFDPEQD